MSGNRNRTLIQRNNSLKASLNHLRDQIKSGRDVNGNLLQSSRIKKLCRTVRKLEHGG